jgi:hypothetical protein
MAVGTRGKKLFFEARPDSLQRSAEDGSRAGELRGTLTDAGAKISSPARSTLASIGHIQSGCCSSARLASQFPQSRL